MDYSRPSSILRPAWMAAPSRCNAERVG